MPSEALPQNRRDMLRRPNTNINLILVTYESPHQLYWPVRQRTEDRVILGPLSPFLSMGHRPHYH
jgi:hypothetical protein